MKIELTAAQKEAQAQFREFVDREIMASADLFDEQEQTPSDLIKKLTEQGYIGATLPPSLGGRGMDMISYGLLNEEIGRGSASVRCLLTVGNMVAQALFKWGNEDQQQHWLPRIAKGELIAAFALTEPNVGSNAAGVETVATPTDDGYLLNGQKQWITYGQIADLFLVFARCQGLPAAFLVERNSPGLTIKPIKGMLGLRAAMLAELHFNDCLIAKQNIVGKPGFGISYIAATALDDGRYTVAWGCVGLLQASLEASLRYVNQRKQFGQLLKEHQLVQRMIADMITNVKAARLLCFQAGYLKDNGDPAAIAETFVAKYFAATMCMRSADDAVQIHGANGCSSAYPVQRYLRDAKIMEIIEGSTQVQQISIAKYWCGS